MPSPMPEAPPVLEDEAVGVSTHEENGGCSSPVTIAVLPLYDMFNSCVRSER